MINRTVLNKRIMSLADVRENNLSNIRQHIPPALCQSGLVDAGQDQGHEACLWPPEPRADRSDPPGKTKEKLDEP